MPLLCRTSGEDMDKLKIITGRAAKLFWITGGDLLGAKDPKAALAFGVFRALRIEQPSKKLFALDLDRPTDTESSTTAIKAVVQEGLKNNSTDYEYIQKNGSLLVSRWIPDEPLNEEFCDVQGRQIIPTALQRAGLCQLSIRTPGQLNSLHFMERSQDTCDLPSDCLQVLVKCYGLNAKVPEKLHFVDLCTIF